MMSWQAWMLRPLPAATSQGGNRADLDVAKPNGLFAFVLYISLMGLWAMRRRRLRECVLRRMSGCMCVVLLLPCAYGFGALWLLYAGSLWPMFPSFVCVLWKMLSIWAQTPRLVSSAEATCARGSCMMQTRRCVPKVRPWNISGVRGRRRKKQLRWILCKICNRTERDSKCQKCLGWLMLCLRMVTSMLRVWQWVWQNHWFLRMVVFAWLWVCHGQDPEYGFLAAIALFCTIGNLHCSWCRTISFVTCWLGCPSHGIREACICALLVPFAPKPFPQVEVRKATVRDREIECLRWRCRNTQLPEAHLDLFLSHGMVASAKCHTLEMKTMTTAERKALKESDC